MSTGLVERGLGGQKAAQLLAQRLRDLRDLEARGGARVGAHDPGATGVGDDRDPIALGQRLVGEQRGDVEQLGEALGADHSDLPEEGVGGQVRPGEHRSGV